MADDRLDTRPEHRVALAKIAERPRLPPDKLDRPDRIHVRVGGFTRQQTHLSDEVAASKLCDCPLIAADANAAVEQEEQPFGLFARAGQPLAVQRCLRALMPPSDKLHRRQR